MSSYGGKADLGRRPAELGGEQVEGHHAVRALLMLARRRAKRVWVSAARASTGPLSEILELAHRERVPVELKSAEVLSGASLTGAAQGVIAWAAPVRAASLDEIIEAARPEPFLVVLDGVTDPGNFGAVLRTAVCAGVAGIVIGRHRSAPLTAAAMKAAAGAAELMPIAQVPGIPGALAQLARSGVWVAGLDPLAKEDIWRSPILDGPVALVLGAEGGGLSRLSRQRCDSLLKVPQAPSLGSLNVSAAAAVACFEVARRREQAGSRSTAFARRTPGLPL
jgi:23S rRNA (guanosine2251-2'-O)-methyltransferase